MSNPPYQGSRMLFYAHARSKDDKTTTATESDRDNIENEQMEVESCRFCDQFHSDVPNLVLIHELYRHPLSAASAGVRHRSKMVEQTTQTHEWYRPAPRSITDDIESPPAQTQTTLKYEGMQEQQAKPEVGIQQQPMDATKIIYRPESPSESSLSIDMHQQHRNNSNRAKPSSSSSSESPNALVDDEQHSQQTQKQQNQDRQEPKKRKFPAKTSKIPVKKNKKDKTENSNSSTSKTTKVDDDQPAAQSKSSQQNHHGGLSKPNVWTNSRGRGGGGGIGRGRGGTTYRYGSGKYGRGDSSTSSLGSRRDCSRHSSSVRCTRNARDCMYGVRCYKLHPPCPVNAYDCGNNQCPFEHSSYCRICRSHQDGAKWFRGASKNNRAGPKKLTHAATVDLPPPPPSSKSQSKSISQVTKHEPS